MFYAGFDLLFSILFPILFHAVAALYLKGHIIGRERMRHRIVCMVVRNFRSLCHHRCWNGQPRRMVVFVPCADISDDGV